MTRLPRPARVVPIALLVAVAAVAAAPAPGAWAIEPTGPKVVVVGVPDLRWDDVSPSATPRLWGLAERGSIGALSVHAVGFATSCAGGWLSFGAGDRATASDLDETRPCGSDLVALTSGLAGEYLRDVNRRTSFRARPSALGGALRRARIRAYASGAGAALALSGTAGVVAPGDGGLDIDDEPGLYETEGSTRASALRDIDARVGEVEDALEPGGDLVVAGLSDHSHGSPHLHVALAVGPGFGRAVLRSASTGRAPFVQLIDLGPTVLARLGVARPTAMVGSPWFAGAPRHEPLQATVAHFIDIDRAAHASSVTGRSFRKLYALALFVAFGLGMVVLRAPERLRRQYPRVRRMVGSGMLGVACLPVATFVVQAVPWWRWGGGGAVFYAVIVGFCALGVGAALVAARAWGPWAAVATIAAGTAIILVADMATGARLQISAIFGDSPLIAGRFHGAGNVDFALISTSMLLSAGCAGYRLRRRGKARAAVLATAAIAAGAVILDGAPPLGDDLGGTLALAPAALFLVAAVGRWAVSWPNAALAAVVGVLPALAFAGYDYSLPEQRQSHIGRFVGQMLHGGAATVVRRKAGANLHQLTNPTLLLPFAAAVLLIAALSTKRPAGVAATTAAFARLPEIKAAFVAVLVCAVLGGALNDSGAAIPVSAAAVALSLLVWLCLGSDRPPAGSKLT